jgi:hypothetical protein
MSLNLPEPNHARRNDQSHEQPYQNSGSRRRETVRDREWILNALAALAGLVAIGTIKPAKANAIRACYDSMLKGSQSNEQQSTAEVLSNAQLLEAMRLDPEVFNLLEPLLTDEQIALIMQGGDGHGQT